MQDIVQVGTSAQFLAALRQDGSVWMQGMTFNVPGRPGLSFHKDPAMIGDLSKAIRISVGEGENVAGLTEDGAVWVWGLQKTSGAKRLQLDRQAMWNRRKGGRS